MYATDHGVVPQFAIMEVYIQVEDVNDNAPLTSDPVYHPVVMENSPKDLSVIQIQAQDPDATGGAERLSYRIASGNPQNFFTINTRTGEWGGGDGVCRVWGEGMVVYVCESTETELQDR